MLHFRSNFRSSPTNNMNHVLGFACDVDFHAMCMSAKL